MLQYDKACGFQDSKSNCLVKKNDLILMMITFEVVLIMTILEVKQLTQAFKDATCGGWSRYSVESS